MYIADLFLAHLYIISLCTWHVQSMRQNLNNNGNVCGHHEIFICGTDNKIKLNNSKFGARVT